MEAINASVIGVKYLTIGGARRRAEAEFGSQAVVYKFKGFFFPGKQTKHALVRSAQVWPDKD